jgi:hypothetical protein
MTCDDPAIYPSPDLQEYLEEREIEAKTVEEAKKARLVESVKKAKAKYYQKIKNDPDFQENIKKNSKIYYERHKDEPEFREAQRLRAKQHSEKNKEYYQNYRYEKKVKEVTQKLESFGFERIEEILIVNKKVKMLDVSINEIE